MNDFLLKNIVNYFTVESNGTEKMPINYFVSKIYHNCNIDPRDDENNFLRLYTCNEMSLKSDYLELFTNIYNSKNGEDKIERIIKYFNIDITQDNSSERLLTDDVIEKMSKFLAGRLPYNTFENKLKFNKYILKYFNNNYNNENEFITILNLAKNDSTTYYFFILDELNKDNTSKQILVNTISELLLKYKGGENFIKENNIIKTKNNIENTVKINTGTNNGKKWIKSMIKKQLKKMRY